MIVVGWKIGAPSLKLNNAGVVSKHCGDFGGVAREALQEREGHDPDIDRERAALNQFQGYQTAADLMEYSRKHVEQLRDAKGRKLRKDAVVMCATILKPPAAYMATLSMDDRRRFLQDANEAFAEIVGRENIKSRADHFDELGEHSHVFWEPMTEDGRLCAKEVHNLQFFGRVNRELPVKLREKGWDIEDCECYDAAKEEYEKAQKQNGRSSVAFKADAEKKKGELIKEIEDLEQKKADANTGAGDAQERQRESEAAAQEAARKAAEAEAEARAIQERMNALQAPESVQKVKGKRSFGGRTVKLPAAEFELLKDYAASSAAAISENRSMAADWDKMAADAEAAARESAQLRQEAFDRQLQIFDLKAQVSNLQKEVERYRTKNQSLKQQLQKIKEVARGEAGFVSKLARILPGVLGDTAFLSAINKATGMKFGSMRDFMDYRTRAEQTYSDYERATKALLAAERQSKGLSK